jgi:hypothetical protein
MPGAYLTTRDRRTIIRLLGLLQDHLESAIESVIVPGTGEADPDEPEDVAGLAQDRRDWRAAEILIGKLTKQRREGNERNKTSSL